MNSSNNHIILNNKNKTYICNKDISDIQYVNKIFMDRYMIKNYTFDNRKIIVKGNFSNIISIKNCVGDINLDIKSEKINFIFINRCEFSKLTINFNKNKLISSINIGLCTIINNSDWNFISKSKLHIIKINIQQSTIDIFPKINGRMKINLLFVRWNRIIDMENIKYLKNVKFMDLNNSMISKLSEVNSKSLLTFSATNNLLKIFPVFKNCIPSNIILENNLITNASIPDGPKYINLNNNYIGDINLEKNNTLKNLSIKNNLLSTINNIPDSIFILNINNNPLISIESIPKNIRRLYCNDNQLLFLPELKKSPNAIYHFKTINPSINNLIENNLDEFIELQNFVKMIISICQVPTLSELLLQKYYQKNFIKIDNKEADNAYNLEEVDSTDNLEEYVISVHNLHMYLKDFNKYNNFIEYFDNE